jgi:hypothetical protein
MLKLRLAPSRVSCIHAGRRFDRRRPGHPAGYLPRHIRRAGDEHQHAGRADKRMDAKQIDHAHIPAIRSPAKALAIHPRTPPGSCSAAPFLPGIANIMAPSGRRQMPSVASAETLGCRLPHAANSRLENEIPGRTRPLNKRGPDSQNLIPISPNRLH